MVKIKLLVALVAGLVAAIGVWVWAQNDAEAPTTAGNPAQSQTSSAPTKAVKPADKLLIGVPDAPVTIIEYGDFQCPICKRFFEQTGPALRREYIDNGKANIEFRVETHIGEESVLAGQAAWCANDQGEFPAYHDELYRRQSGSNAGAFSLLNLKSIAAELKLDQKKFGACLDSQKYLATVQASHAEAQSRGVTATPTFFIGGQKIVGAQPIGIFRTLLDD